MWNKISFICSCICLSRFYVVILCLSLPCVGFDLESAQGSSASYITLYSNTTLRVMVIIPSRFDIRLLNIDMH